MTSVSLDSCLLEQISKFDEHLSNCQSAAAVCQFKKTYTLQDGCVVDVLLRNNHATRRRQAFVQLSKENDEVAKIAKTILERTFEFSREADIKNQWSSSMVCSRASD